MEGPLPQPAALSVMQQGMLDVFNKDVGEEEHFPLSLVPTLNDWKIENKALARIKIQLFL